MFLRPTAIVRFHITMFVLAKVPELLQFMQVRALVACRENDIVVLYEPNLCPWHTKQEVALLHQLGFGPNPYNVLTVHENGGLQMLMSGRELDGGLARRMLKGRHVQTFSGVDFGDRLDRLRPRFDCQFWGPSKEQATYFNSKAWFQSLQKRHPIPEGFVATRQDVLSVLVTALNLYGRVILKPDHAASGIGQQVITCIEDFRVLEPGYDTWIIQKFIPGTKLYDGSVNFVKLEGKLRDIKLVNQHVEGTSHGGNFSYEDEYEDIAKNILETARALILTELADVTDAVGSIDFVVTELPSGEHLFGFVEMNLRWTAPRYAMQALERRFGPHNTLSWDMWSCRIPAHRTLQGIMDEIGLSDRGTITTTQTGVIPFCFIPDPNRPEVNFVYFLAFAPTKEKRDEIAAAVRQAVQRINNDAANMPPSKARQLA